MYGLALLLLELFLCCSFGLGIEQFQGSQVEAFELLTLKPWIFEDMGKATKFRSQKMDYTFSEQYVLNGSLPNPGQYGLWTHIEGLNHAIFDDMTDPHARVTLPYGCYGFVWATLPNPFWGGPLPTSAFERVVEEHRVVRVQLPNAGVDQYQASHCTHLNATPPLSSCWAGRWVLLKGRARILRKDSAITSACGLGDGENVFMWKIWNVDADLQFNSTVKIVVDPIYKTTNPGPECQFKNIAFTPSDFPVGSDVTMEEILQMREESGVPRLPIYPDVYAERIHEVHAELDQLNRLYPPFDLKTAEEIHSLKDIPLQPIATGPPAHGHGHGGRGGSWSLWPFSALVRWIFSGVKHILQNPMVVGSLTTLLGLGLGFLAARWLLNKLSQWLSPVLAKLLDRFRAVYTGSRAWLYRQIARSENWVENWIHRLGQWTKNQLTRVGHSIQNGMNRVLHVITGQTQRVLNWFKNGLNQAFHFLVGRVQRMINWMAATTKQWLGKLFGWAKRLLGRIEGWIEHVVSKWMDWMEHQLPRKIGTSIGRLRSGVNWLLEKFFGRGGGDRGPAAQKQHRHVPQTVAALVADTGNGTMEVRVFQKAPGHAVDEIMEGTITSAGPNTADVTFTGSVPEFMDQAAVENVVGDIHQLFDDMPPTSAIDLNASVNYSEASESVGPSPNVTPEKELKSKQA